MAKGLARPRPSGSVGPDLSVASVLGMRIAFGTDESTPVTEDLVSDLERLDHSVLLAAIDSPWAEVGAAVGHLVASGQADVGIVCCFTGTGVTMAANKVEGVRAALCTDAETARGARRWNDANVVGLSLRLATSELAREIVEAFFRTPFDPSEAAQVALLSAPGNGIEPTGP